jgi:preprotein translocase subunit SecG
MVSFFLNFFFVVFILVSVLLILIILIQKGRGGGLSSAFGGGGGGSAAFGAKTGDVLTWATSIIFGIFLQLAIVLNLLSNSVTSANAVVVPPPSGNSGNPTQQLPTNPPQ